MSKSIGLLVVATNKYITFVPPLLESVRRHFLRGHDVTLFVFTNMNAPAGVVHVPHQHQPWPAPTLLRYHAFWRERERFSKLDYLYYCDADMRFVGDVGEEVFGELVATRHPNFYDKGVDDFTYERRAESAACVPIGHGRAYYAGGFQGGSRERFLLAASDMSEGIERDLAQGIVAVWHDESHFNRYLIDHAPTVELSPGYCYPEGGKLPFTPKLLALLKDHHKFRETGLRSSLRSARAVVRRVVSSFSRSETL